MASIATQGSQEAPSKDWIANLDRYCSLNPEGAIIEA